MSSVNYSNINSETINTVNLNVKYVNGRLFRPLICVNGIPGYIVTNGDCNGNEENEDCVDCDYVPDICERFVPCGNGGGGGGSGTGYTGPTGPPGSGTAYTGPTGPPGTNGTSYTGPTGADGTSYTGPTGPTGAQGTSYTGPTGPSAISTSLYNYYFDLESGCDNISNGQGPGYTLSTQTISGVSTTVAFMYPSVNYFNENAGGTSPWNSYVNGSNGSFNSNVNTNIFYKMPNAGTISAVSINNLSWFTNTNGYIEIIIANDTTYTAAGVSLPKFSAGVVTFPINAYTTTINFPSFNAGDGIACVIAKESATSWSTPFSPISGLINISVYVKFSP